MEKISDTYQIDHCPNCGFGLSGEEAYCPACGQKNSRVRISLRELLYDFFAGLLNLDNKIYRTLKTIWIPGKLTQLFFAGKRVSFTHPLRLYLFISFILFAIIGYRFNQSFKESTLAETLDIHQAMEKKKDLATLDSLVQLISSQPVEPDRATGARVLQYLFALDTNNVDIKDTLQMELGYINMDLDSINSNWTVQDEQALLIHQKSDTIFQYSLAKARELYRLQIEPDTLKLMVNLMKQYGHFDQGIAMKDLMELENEALYEKYEANSFSTRIFLSQTSKIVRDPGSALYYVLSGFSWIALLFIPFMALWQALIYLRRKKYYVEHLVFTAHSTSMLFLAIILCLLISLAFNRSEVYLVLLAFPLYLLVAYRRFYQQNWFKTILKWGSSQFMALLLISVLTTLSILVRTIIY